MKHELDRNGIVMTGGSFLEYRVRFFLIFLFFVKVGGGSGSSGSSEVVKVQGRW